MAGPLLCVALRSNELQPRPTTAVTKSSRSGNYTVLMDVDRQ